MWSVVPGAQLAASCHQNHAGLRSGCGWSANSYESKLCEQRLRLTPAKVGSHPESPGPRLPGFSSFVARLTGDRLARNPGSFLWLDARARRVADHRCLGGNRSQPKRGETCAKQFRPVAIMPVGLTVTGRGPALDGRNRRGRGWGRLTSTWSNIPHAGHRSSTERRKSPPPPCLSQYLLALGRFGAHISFHLLAFPRMCQWCPICHPPPVETARLQGCAEFRQCCGSRCRAMSAPPPFLRHHIEVASVTASSVLP